METRGADDEQNQRNKEIIEIIGSVLEEKGIKYLRKELLR